MLIRSTTGSVELALRLIRSAQIRLDSVGTRLATGGSDSEDPNLLQIIRLAKQEQRLAMTMLNLEQEHADSTIDLIA